MYRYSPLPTVLPYKRVKTRRIQRPSVKYSRFRPIRPIPSPLDVSDSTFGFKVPTRSSNFCQSRRKIRIVDSNGFALGSPSHAGLRLARALPRRKYGHVASLGWIRRRRRPGSPLRRNAGGGLPLAPRTCPPRGTLPPGRSTSESSGPESPCSPSRPMALGMGLGLPSVREQKGVYGVESF